MSKRNSKKPQPQEVPVEPEEDGVEELGFGVDHVPRTDPMAGQLIRLLVVEDEEKDYRALAAMLRKIERCFFELDWARTYDAGGATKVAASIGIAVFPQDAPTTEGLLRNAEDALDLAKRRGGSGFQFHSPTTTERVEIRQSLATQLEGALGRNEFLLHYQPVVTCKGRHPRAVEALIRWQTDDMRLVSPREFVPVLEQSERMGAVSAWMLNRAAADFAGFLRFAPPGVRVAINLTKTELMDPQLLPRLVHALHNNGIRPSLVQIDIPERVIVESPDDLEGPTHDLKALGVSLAVDEFGTAGASLAVLARFPFDAIKLDAQFTANIAIDRRAAEVAGALIATGHGLGMEVYADGVQTREQLAVLQGRGCDTVQGFLFGGPTSAEATVAWLKRVKAALAGRRKSQRITK